MFLHRLNAYRLNGVPENRQKMARARNVFKSRVRNVDVSTIKGKLTGCWLLHLILLKNTGNY